MDTLRVPVFVESWQIECCGTPPGVGDRVEWRLSFRDEAGSDPGAGKAWQRDAGLVSLAMTAEPYRVKPSGGGTAAERTRLAAGGLHAFWSTAAGPRGPVQVTGRLTEDHHVDVPPDFPPTVGTVARVRIVSRSNVPHPTQPRVWVPGTAAPRYRDVDRSPKWFDRRTDHDGLHRTEDGVLVDLVVPAA